MIVLFTDFGVDDIYVGQIHAVLAEHAPGVAVIDLLHNAPAFEVHFSARLFFALQKRFPGGTVFMTVVDPGVGGDRAPLLLQVDDKWFVGPDNGLLTGVIRHAQHSVASEILWRPTVVSPSFHGRDIFAPVAAMLATGQAPRQRPITPKLLHWPDELDQVIYIDHYGNAITGRSGETVSEHQQVRVGNTRIQHARTFCENEPSQLFWYINSIGLVEIAANRASAAEILKVQVGSELTIMATS